MSYKLKGGGEKKRYRMSGCLSVEHCERGDRISPEKGLGAAVHGCGDPSVSKWGSWVFWAGNKTRM